MKQLILAVIFLWAAVLLIPGLSERAEPRIASVRGWFAERTEGPLTPIRNRYRTAQVRSHLDKASRALVIQRNQGITAPDQESLPRFLARHDIVSDGLDPWGTPYLIVQEADSLAIISAGPDLTYYTEQDLVIRVRYARPGPLRRSR